MPPLFQTLVSVTLATGFVLVLAYFSLLLLRRYQLGRTESGGMTFLRSIPVGPRERVTLVSYRGQTYMLGVTAGAITLLDQMDDEIVPETLASTAKSKPAAI